MNKVYRLNGDLHFELADRDCQLFFPINKYQRTFNYWIEVSIDNHSFYVNFDLSHSEIKNSIYRIFGNDFPLEEIPKAIYNAVVESFVEDLLKMLEECAELSVELKELSETEISHGEYDVAIPFHIAGNNNEEIVRGIGYLNTDTFEFLSELLYRGNINKTQMSYLNSVPIYLSIVIGTTTISAEQVTNLKANDIILMDTYYPLEEKRVLVVLSNNMIWADIDNTAITIIGKKETEMTEEEREVMENSDDVDTIEDTEEDTIIDAEDIELTLLFEVGHKKILLSQLQDIKPGYTFELDTPVDKNVTIRVNGRKVGYGELVQINDRIGVRILELVNS
ncbi:MAG: type III secretion system cytoplasmic ring protein SctQ [Deltaproteobacteria bacterium]|nr:type III secretion system cytoplasmic ring protein SctQ [Deltaproteobacteria bacterium]